VLPLYKTFHAELKAGTLFWKKNFKRFWEFPKKNSATYFFGTASNVYSPTLVCFTFPYSKEFEGLASHEKTYKVDRSTSIHKVCGREQKRQERRRTKREEGSQGGRGLK
jgi:hypothetical protein